jgi:hypothetical protein
MIDTEMEPELNYAINRHHLDHIAKKKILFILKNQVAPSYINDENVYI